MLEFFRKYQSIIYIFVTVMIVISFSFFGTYSTIVSNPIRDQVAFTAVDGTVVRRSDLDEVVLFISSDSHDKVLFGGIWGPNFLNDGVIRKDILSTGVGQILALGYAEDLEEELVSRHEKEKRYQPYVHPQAEFINAETVWDNYAPGIKAHLHALQAAPSAMGPSALNARMQLYVAHSHFPAHFLRQVLQHQEQQFSFVRHDWELDQSDLSLFGYHTLDDWFGPRFVRLTAQFIINAAKIAEEKGYSVSREEALADLLRNAQVSYEQNVNNPNIGVTNSGDYFNEQLRRLNMDQNQAVKVWQQVLLFRRLFHNVGNTVFVDPLVYNQFNGYAQEAVSGDRYALAREFHLSDANSLLKLEIYLNGISKRSEELLLPPTTFLSVDEVARRAPELVQKRYFLKVASLDTNALQGRVSLRDTWNFEADHWDKMTKQFPELGIKNAQTREERISALDSLDNQTRARADAFARAAIVEANPEWRKEALNSATEKTMTIGFSSGVPAAYFEGNENGNELIRKLDKAGEEPLVYSADGRHYYKITVLDKSEARDILTFAEASQQGILDGMLAKSDEPDLYLASLLKAADIKTAALLAPIRFHTYMQAAKARLEKDPEAAAELVATASVKSEGLAERPALADQWKLIKTAARIQRGDGVEDPAIFTLAPNSWSSIQTPPNGDLSFVHIQKVGESALDTAAAAKKLNQLKQLLAGEAQRSYMARVVEELKAKNAMSLAYLLQTIEPVEAPELPEEF